MLEQKFAKSELKPGDLVFFHKTYNKKGITHAGIYIGNNQFITRFIKQRDKNRFFK